MNELEKIISYGLLNKKFLISKCFLGSIDQITNFSNIWKFFLIIFSKTNKIILEPNEWLNILDIERDKAQKLLDFEFKTTLNNEHSIIIKTLGIIFFKKSYYLNQNIINKLEKIIKFFIKFNSNQEFIEIICNIITILYNYFNTQKYNGEKEYFKILNNEKFLYEDIFLSLQSIIIQFSSFFDNNEFILNYIYLNNSYNKKINNNQDIKEILNHYQTFFSNIINNNNDLINILSIIFCQYPKSSIFFDLTQLINFKNNEIKLIIKKIGLENKFIIEESNISQLKNIISLIDQFLIIIQKNDSILYRNLLNYYLENINDIFNNKININEIFPLNDLINFLK